MPDETKWIVKNNLTRQFLDQINQRHKQADHNEADSSAELQAELDPPPGARRGWLDSVLTKHEFIVLVFYRGFW